MSHASSRNATRTTGSTLVRFLKTRSTECWGFFAAGFLLCAILS